MTSFQEIKLKFLFYPLLFKLCWRTIWKLNFFMKYEKLTKIGGQTIINSYLPAYPSPAFNRYVDLLSGLEKGRMAPQVGIISVTDECPYNCYHCSNEISQKKKNPDLSLLLKAIKELVDCGVYKIGISGGEPFMRKDLVELVASASPYAQVLINTTGHNVQLEDLKKLKEAGLTGLRISLDHYDENEFDRLRGYQGAFKNALSCIGLSLEANLYTVISFVPAKGMVQKKELERFMAFAEKTGAHEVTIFETKPAGRLFNSPSEFFLNDKEREALVELQKNINSDRKRKIKVLSFPYLEGKRMIGCTAGSLYFYIDARGAVFPCLFYPFELGNINKEPLADIIKRSQEIFPGPKCCCLAFDGRKIIKSGQVKEELKKLSTKYNKLPDFYASLLKK
jgi:MoaA/NifB/PqqE/SkfB family radical SAM enzyme